MPSPEQEIYDYFFGLSEQWAYNTYDHLPMQNEHAPYPFVLVGDLQVVPRATKSSINGNILLIIDIWGNQKQRFTISEMAERFFHAAIGELLTDHYRFYGRTEDQTKEFTQDQSVPNTVLNRAVVTLNLNIL